MFDVSVYWYKILFHNTTLILDGITIMNVYIDFQLNLNEAFMCGICKLFPISSHQMHDHAFLFEKYNYNYMADTFVDVKNYVRKTFVKI